MADKKLKIGNATKEEVKTINLRERVEVKLKKDYNGATAGSTISTHPENVKHYKKLGLIE